MVKSAEASRVASNPGVNSMAVPFNSPRVPTWQAIKVVLLLTAATHEIQLVAKTPRTPHAPKSRQTASLLAWSITGQIRD
jgi:hypothetical protein